MLRRHGGGPAQDGGHDRKVSGRDHAHTPVTGQAVQFLVVSRGQPAGADHHMDPGLDRGPGVAFAETDVDHDPTLRNRPGLHEMRGTTLASRCPDG